MYYSRVASYGGIPDLARAKRTDVLLQEAEVLLQAREQARHEALLERRGGGEHTGLRFLARFVPAFGGRTKVAGEAVEALAAACARARQWVSLSLDGELAHPEQALLTGHLKNCASCSSFQALSRASTAMPRGAPPERPEGRAAAQEVA
jgi:Putative zinc-finger